MLQRFAACDGRDVSRDADGSQTDPTMDEDEAAFDAPATVTPTVHAQLMSRRTRRQVDFIPGVIHVLLACSCSCAM